MKPPWMIGAEKDLGQHEIAGDRANPRVMAMFKAIGADWVKDDATPWCAAGVGAWLEEAGVRSTRDARARSYLSWGLELAEPVLGCVTVISRGSDPSQGHVGLFAGLKDGKVLLLGGNQGDEVSYAAFDATRVLGHRWPAGVPLPTGAEAAEGSRIVARAATLQRVGVVTAITGGATTVGPALPIPAAPDLSALGPWKSAIGTLSDLVTFTASHWPVALAVLGVYLVLSGGLISRWRLENARQWIKGALG